MSKIINDEFSIISINLIIKSNWENILDSQITQFIRFSNASVPVTKKTPELNVIIDVLSSAIFLAKRQNDAIISSIRLLTGIENINIRYRQVLNFNNTLCVNGKREMAGC